MRCHLQPLPLGRRALADYAVAAMSRSSACGSSPSRCGGCGCSISRRRGSRLRSPEILPSLLSLYDDLGLEAEFWALAGDRPLWQLVRQLEDGLQGGETAISDDAWDGAQDGRRPPQATTASSPHGPGPLAAAATGPRPAAPGARARRTSASRPAGRGVRRASVPLGRLLAAGLAEVVEWPEAIDPLAPARWTCR